MTRINMFLWLFVTFLTITLLTYEMEYKTDSEKFANYACKMSEDVLRFHLRANSDSDEDQALKMLVKAEIVTYLQNLLKNTSSASEASDVVAAHFEEVKNIADAVIASQGSDYDVKVYIEQDYFPIRIYGDEVYPCGIYNALRIDIGSAQGHNWWCMLYPKLCFVDSCYAVCEDSDDISEDMCDTCVQNPETDKKYEFRILRFLNRYL